MTELSVISDQNQEVAASEFYLKPTATIHIGNNLTFIERKLFNLLIWHSQVTKFTEKKEALRFDDAMEIIGLKNSRNRDVIKEALETLVTSKITWNTLARDKTKGSWGVCTFLAGAEIVNGNLKYLVNPYLLEKIVNPIVYAKIQLLVQAQFKSKYSLIIYEYLIDELSRRRETKLTLTIELDLFREIVNYDGAYRSLNNDIIKPSIKEINKKTEIEVDLNSIKKGRKVVGLELVIEKKKQFQLSLELPSRRIIDKLTDKQEELKKGLMEYGITEHKATELVITYSEDRVGRNIQYVINEAKKKGKEIRNQAAYILRAIEEDYKPKTTTYDKNIIDGQHSQKIKEIEIEKEEKKVEKENQDFQTFRRERLASKLEALGSSWEEKRLKKYEKKLKEGKYPILKDIYRRNGMASPMISNAFRSELLEELLKEPEEISIENYIKWKNNEPSSN